jgi:hypothetical protein
VNGGRDGVQYREGIETESILLSGLAKLVGSALLAPLDRQNQE